MSVILHDTFHTPLRDLARGRLTGRLDWRGVLAETDLPADVKQVIATVVGRSRLWRLEKADVAADLIAHFTDALADGEMPEDVITNFGNPADAAKLIRRAKQRQRGWPWRVQQAVLLLAIAAVAFYGLLLVQYYLRSPTPNIDYVSRVNAEVAAIPAADRAWPLYERLLPEPLVGKDGEYRRMTLVPAKRDILYEAVAKPRIARPLPPAAFISGEADLRGEIWVIALALKQEAEASVVADDPVRAADAYAALLRFAGQLLREPFLVHFQSGTFWEAEAHRQLGRLIYERPSFFTADQITGLAGVIRDLPPLVPDPTWDRYRFDDARQNAFTNGGDGRLTDDGAALVGRLGGYVLGDPFWSFEPWMRDGPFDVAWSPVLGALVADGGEQKRVFEEMLVGLTQDAAEPMVTRGDGELGAYEALYGKLIDEQPVRYAPVIQWAPSGGAFYPYQIAEYRGVRRATLMALEAGRARVESNAWPETLIAPLADPFFGGDLVYRLTTEGPMVGVKVPEDGTPPWWGWEARDEVRDGLYVLWPRL